MKCELIFYLAGRTGQLEELLEELLRANRLTGEQIAEDVLRIVR